MKTGKQIWKQKFADYKEGYIGVISPLVANGIVFYGCLNGYVYALYSSVRGDQPERLPVWQFVTGGAIYSSGAVADGRLYIGSDDGMLYSFGLP